MGAQVTHKPDRVESIEKDSDWYWGYLVPGFCFREDGDHFAVEDTRRKLNAKLRREIVPCDCDSCLAVIRCRAHIASATGAQP